MLIEDNKLKINNAVDPRSRHVIVTSAKSQASHQANKRNLLHWLQSNSNIKIQDIAYTTTARRMHHSLRFACTASITEELIGKLQQESAELPPSRSSPIVFVFTGQGSHYAGMASELYATSDLFRATADLCASICKELTFPPFLDIITDNTLDMSSQDTMQTQLAVITLEIALATFWISCGLQPAAVIGHSLGEYTALHVAGVLSLADTLYLVGNRARLFLERCELGSCSMLAIAAP